MFRTLFRKGQGRAARQARPSLEALEDRVVPSFAAPVSYNVGAQADGFNVRRLSSARTHARISAQCHLVFEKLGSV